MDNKIVFPNEVEVLPLGQGTWYMGEDTRKRTKEINALQRGIDLGMTAIDTAELYGDGLSEELVGEAIASRRDKVFLISKVLPSNASQQGTKRACERSLKRLRTDYIDLYLLHWRGRYPLEDTVKAMLELQQEGKIRQWGVSNFDVDDMEEIHNISGGDTCATNEVLYNLSRRGIEYDLLPWCEDHQMPVIAYSPIEQGRILNEKLIIEIADKHKATAAQIALAWVLSHPSVMAIPKAGSIEHVEDNFKSLSIRLDEEDFDRLNQVFPHPEEKVSLAMI